MSKPNEWSDRRGMFQGGKQVHEPSSPTVKKFHETGAITNAVRRASTSSNSGGSPLDKTPTGGSGGSFPTASGRRRSSAASGGMFAGLTNQKRGSEDYSQRRESHNEMTGGSGMLGGWFNSTFKGYQKPAGGDQNKDQKRGVME